MKRAYGAITAVIFFAIAMAHLSRLIVGWEVTIANWVVPQWVSVAGLIIAGLLSLWGFKLSHRPGTRRKYHT